MPVSEQDIARYHISNKQLAEIKASQKFAKTAKARSVRYRESRNNYRARTGQYGGAWQLNPGMWKGNGGRQFAKSPQTAPAFAQDYITWRIVKKVGWRPWGA